MRLEDINFPVYRKYKNGRSYFKIINPTLLEEIQVVGSRHILHRLVATLYPDKLFVSDLLTKQEMTDPSTEEEYNSFQSRV